jgi:flagellar hook-length control protein FliK
MISSIFFQELIAGNMQGIFSSGKEISKQGEDVQSGFTAVLNRLMNDSDTGGDVIDFGEVPLRGHRFLDYLKKAIMASGISLGANRINRDTLTEFQELLVKAGFNRQEIQEMISDLTSNGPEGGVPLATLFARASQLSEPDDNSDGSLFLEISALPYIETILAQLGMDDASIQSVLSDAKIEGIGIDIETLAVAIRRVMATHNQPVEPISGAPDEILNMMRRIGLLEDDTHSLKATLDKMISGLLRLNKKEVGDANEDETENEGSIHLVIPYLQQLAASLGEDGETLRQLIGSAGKGDTAFNGEALLVELLRIRQELSAAPAVSDMPKLSGTSGEIRMQGSMNLSQFVSALEARISTAQHMNSMLTGETSTQPMIQMAGKFLETISSGVAVTHDKLSGVPITGKQTANQETIQEIRSAVETFVTGTDEKGNPVKHGLEGIRLAVQKAATGAGERDGGGQYNGGGSKQAAETSTDGAGRKGAPEHTILAASRPLSTGGDTGRQSMENSTGKEESSKFMDHLVSAGKLKGKKTSEQRLPATDNFIKAIKTADGVSVSVKASETRTLPGYLLDQVSRQIVRLRTAGENEITLQLKPPHLGRMKLNVEHTSGGIKVGIVVESATAKEMLLSHTNELKAALGDQGLRLDKIDVGIQNDFGRSMAQADRDFSRSGGQSGRQNDRDVLDSHLTPEELVRPETIRNVEAGRLNLVA